MPPQKKGRKKKRVGFTIPSAYLPVEEKRIDEPPDRTEAEREQMTTEDVLSAYLRNTETENQQREREAMGKEDNDAGRFRRREVRGRVMQNEDLLRVILSYTQRPLARELVRKAPNVVRILHKNGDLEDISKFLQGKTKKGEVFALRSGDNIIFKLRSGANDYVNYFKKDGGYRYYEWEESGLILDPDVPNAYENENGYVNMEDEVNAFNSVMGKYGLSLDWNLHTYDTAEEDEMRIAGLLNSWAVDNYEDTYPKPKPKEEKPSDDEESGEEEDEEEDDDAETKYGDHDIVIGFFELHMKNDRKTRDLFMEIRGVAEVVYPEAINEAREREEMAEEDERSRRVLEAYERKVDDEPPALEPDV